ncbi:MAG TPA: nucleotidyl transferase AbiEii/AbiGii toxin family protein [Candidatus Paceibacterota bacterium]
MESSHLTSVNWRTDSLPSSARKALERLSGFDWLEKSDWYLAGGTALALQVGHRSSVDLDFFLPHKAFDLGSVLDNFASPDWETNISRENTIYGSFMGTKVSFIAYPYFKPALPFNLYQKIKILKPEDIGVMKIVAISQRGRKRDFIDLYWLCQNVKPLFEFVKCLPAQYPSVAHDYHHITKSLTYFEDADKDPMPKLNFKTDWRSVKNFFNSEVRKIAAELMGIGAP